MSKIKVAFFDDNTNLRKSFSLLINNTEGLQMVGAFANCKNLLDDIANADPDVVVMDIHMPGISGIEAVRIIKAAHPVKLVLMQTVFEDEDKIFASICAGASGYILKGITPEKITAAIFETMDGGSPMSPVIARKVLQMFQQIHEKGVAPVTNVDHYNLSAREKEVLHLLVKGQSYKMICDELCISYDTVRSHMKKVYEKLHVSSMTAAVAKALNEHFF